MGRKNKKKPDEKELQNGKTRLTASSDSDKVGEHNKKKPIFVATEVVRLFDAVVDCLKIHLFLLSSSDLEHVNAATEKLMADVANLQILDEATKPSSSQSSENNEISLKVRQQPDDNGSAKTKEEIVAERKAKVAETKARKAAAAEAKKALKENKVDPSTEEKTETGSGIKDGQLKVVRNDQRGKTVERQNRTKDPLLSNAFRAAEPFRAVHFDFTAKYEGMDECPSRQPSFSEVSTANIHPSFIEFCSRCEAKNIVGVDAICIAFAQAFRQFLSDYMVSPNQVISRDLDQAIRPQLSFLTENGKHSFPLALGNLIRQLKKEINHLSDAVSQEEGKEHLQQWLDDFVVQNFELALQAISSFCIEKMKNTPFVLTYSWCPVVERIILDASDRGLSFHVHVLDSPIEKRGKQLVKTLCKRNIRCSYGMVSAAGYLIKQCNMVLLGCSAILSNGFAVAERGTSQVALVASASNIPVLVAAQTCKFVDRVQSFSRGIHEVSALVGERQEAVPADLITAVVTELRILPPSSAPAVLKAKQLAVDS